MYVLTWRAQVSRQLHGDRKNREKLFNESGKTNLETDKWSSLFSEMVSSLCDSAVITELSFYFPPAVDALTGQEFTLH